MRNLSFAETLRRLRIKKGLSQLRLSNLLHVDRSTIAKWETGDRLPDAVMITRLSECLGTDIAELIHASRKNTEKQHVILVDDEKIILSGTLSVLEEALPDAVVTGFLNPAEAEAFAREHQVVLAFLDIEMGRISGLDVCRELLSINARTNVIYLTAYREYAFNAWDTGASGFLLKPLTVDAVRNSLVLLRYPVRGLGAK